MPASLPQLPGPSFLAEVPALFPATGLIGGILLWWIGAPWIVALACAIVGTVAMLLRFHHAAFPLICLGAGWAIALLHAPTPLPAAATICDSWTGVVRDASATPDVVRLIVEVDSVEHQHVTPFRAAVFMHPGGDIPTSGDILRGNCTFTAPSITDAIPGEPDMELYALRNGFSASAFAGDGDLTVIGHSMSAASLLSKWRSRLVAIIAHSGVNDLTFSVVSAILLGYDDEIPPQVRDSFRVAGIAHALALSGFHVGIIVLIATVILWPLRFWPRLRPLWLTLTVGLVWFYAALTGFPLSVVRAVIMFSVWILALIIGRRQNPVNSLCLAVFIIVAVWPFSIFSAGLQLSVAAVAGLLTFTRPLTPVSPRRRTLFRINLTFSTPVAAIIGTMPVTAAWFHSLPVLFLIPNIIIALLMPVWMTGGVLLLLLGAADCPASWIAIPLDVITDVVARGTAAIASRPLAELPGLYLTPLTIAAAIVFTVIAAIALNVNNRRGYIALTITAALFIGISAIPRPLADDEAFITRTNNSAAIVMRHGHSAAAVIVSSPRARDGAIRLLRQKLTPYAVTHRLDTVIFPQGNFSLGPYSRNGDTLRIPSREIILPRRVTRDTLNSFAPIQKVAK